MLQSRVEIEDYAVAYISNTLSHSKSNIPMLCLKSRITELLLRVGLTKRYIHIHECLMEL